VIGASAAVAAAVKGVSVLLIDQFSPGHAHGSSHGDGRIFRQVAALPAPPADAAYQPYDNDKPSFPPTLSDSLRKPGWRMRRRITCRLRRPRWWGGGTWRPAWGRSCS
jgi:glycine/D-amino acid oxidase-like deaminating enzyme